MNSIKDWLNNGKPWALGVALYAAHGGDPIMNDMLAQGHSPYRQKRLEAALRELIAVAQHAPVAQPDIVVSTVNAAQLPEHTVPAEQDPYREKWLPFFKEMNLLRHQLRLMPTQTERGAAAHRILELEDICSEWWDRRDYYLRTGEHMPEPEPITTSITDPNALNKRLTTVRTYVTRYKKLLAKRKDAGTKAKLATFEAERDDLIKKLSKTHGT